MNKIVKSLSVIAFVAAVAIGATSSYFSDEEKSTGNTFTAGTIDIAIDTQNPWTSHYDMPDLKPGETGYINFDITNVGANPVNISKNLSSFQGSTETVTEPECTDQGGYWTNPNGGCNWQGGTDLNNLETQIEYDMYVEVFNDAGTRIWWQQIYNADEHRSLTSVYPDGNTYVALGMIPVGGHMKVKQSYHFSANAGNQYQGDTLSFNITIKGTQLPQGDNGLASVLLENKRIGEPEWDIIQGDGIEGTLSYNTQGPTFDYSFSGRAPLVSHGYVLAIGYNGNTDVDTQIGTGMTDGSGNISISGSVDIPSQTNVKVWLVPTENWSSGMVWTGFPGIVPNFLWETGLINYVAN